LLKVICKGSPFELKFLFYYIVTAMLRGLSFALAILGVVGSDVASRGNGEPDFVQVQTPLGSLKGVDYGDFVAFKGVRYAEPIRRFESPEPKQTWSDVADATLFGDTCPGGGKAHDKDPLESYSESEDCLFANVWLPKGVVNKNKSLPVFVWIHGGGFMFRSGQFAGYWGDGFTQMSQEAILVSLNYRLGVFGFYSSEDTGANFGFQDQQMLLRWVQGNIASFGGNAGQVTIIGQSAGAMSVVCHLAAPGSAGLFHRAVAMSPVGLKYRSKKDNSPFVETVAKAVGCWPSTNLTRCMKGRPWEMLMLADIAPEYIFDLEGKASLNFLPWLPVVDGKTLPATPVDAFKAGTHNKVPTILSTTRNETLAFIPTVVMHLANNQVAYYAAMAGVYMTRAPQIRNHYATSPDTKHMKEGTNLVGIVTTDSLMTCYARYVANLLSHHAPTSLSTFLLPPHASEMNIDKDCVTGDADSASCHAGDVGFFLPISDRMADRTGVAYANKAESNFAQRYTAAIIAFGYGQSSPFTVYNASSDVSTGWDLHGPASTVGYHKAHCDMFEALGFAQNPWGSGDEPTEGKLPIVV